MQNKVIKYKVILSTNCTRKIKKIGFILGYIVCGYVFVDLFIIKWWSGRDSNP